MTEQKINKYVKINKDDKDYFFELINGTQDDGRCFSASVFYDLNGRKAEDDELNAWINKFYFN